MKAIHPSEGEAAFHHGCSVWITGTSGGSSCRSDQSDVGTGYWVWRATSQRKQKYGKFSAFYSLRVD